MARTRSSTARPTRPATSRRRSRWRVKVDTAAPEHDARSTRARRDQAARTTARSTLDADRDRRRRRASPRCEYQVNTAGAVQGAFGAPARRPRRLAWVDLRPGQQAGVHGSRQLLDRLPLHDAAGNVEAAKTVAFSITRRRHDHVAPVTTGTLDPAQPGRRPDVRGPRQRQPLGDSIRLRAGRRRRTSTSTRSATAWDPATLNLTVGRHGSRGTSRPTRVSPHDVWIVRARRQPDPAGTDLEQVTNGIVFPGGPSVVQDAHADRHVDVPLPPALVATAPVRGRGMVGTTVVAAGQTTGTRRPASTSPSTASRPATPRATGCARPTPAARTRSRRTFTVSAEGSAHGRVPLGRQGRQRRGGEVGRVRHRHAGSGLPGDPGVRRPVLGRGSAAGPLLGAPGSIRTAARCPTSGSSPTAGASAARSTRTFTTARHVHGEGDRDRRRGQARPRRTSRSSSRARTSVPPTVDATSDVTRGPAPLQRAVQRRRATIRTAGERPRCTRGTSVTAARRWRRTRPTRT